MDSKLLNRELAQNILTTVYLFVAEDEYIAQSYLQLIKERFIISFPELNITQFEDKNIRASDVLAACAMLPIMAEKRLVVVKEQTFKNKETAEGLVKYMQHPSPDTVLILYCGKADKRTSIYKTAQKMGKVVEFSKLNHGELLQWIRTDVAKNKMEIDADAAEYLIKQSGYLNRESKIDLGYCRNELDKLILYDPKAKKISLETVQKVVSVEANEDLFRFSDALLAGDVQEAFSQMQKIEYRNIPVPVVIASVARTLRNVCICVSAQEKGESAATIAKDYGLHSYVVKKSLEAQKYFSVADAKKSLVVLSDLDVKIKTGQLNPSFALVLLTQNISRRMFRPSEVSL